jgi:pyridoxamine 5'-phosphate oxidase
MQPLHHIRKDYQLMALDEQSVNANPFLQFQEWMDAAIASGAPDATAMILSTVSDHGRPSSRVVLLKRCTDKGFTFFTNYESKKGAQLASNNFASLLFFWPQLERQVRIEGMVEKVSAAESDQYFAERPLQSRIGAWVSPQSRHILSRKILDDVFLKYESDFGNRPILRPRHWGGYRLVPDLFEFWQGRANRLHDRIEFTQNGSAWKLSRLAP